MTDFVNAATPAIAVYDEEPAFADLLGHSFGHRNVQLPFSMITSIESIVLSCKNMMAAKAIMGNPYCGA
jgi:hypothetical protein